MWRQEDKRLKTTLLEAKETTEGSKSKDYQLTA